jgi:hypothetical protein
MRTKKVDLNLNAMKNEEESSLFYVMKKNKEERQKFMESMRSGPKASEDYIKLVVRMFKDGEDKIPKGSEKLLRRITEVGDIKEFLGFYFDKMGNAYNIKGRKLKYTFISNKETIMIDKQRFRVNTIIAQLFVPNPQNYDYVEHINGDPHDLRMDNLKWVLTPMRRSASGLDHYNTTMTKEKVLLVKKLLAEGKLRQWEIAQQVGCSPSRVTYIKQGVSYSDI